MARKRKMSLKANNLVSNHSGTIPWNNSKASDEEDDVFAGSPDKIPRLANDHVVGKETKMDFDTILSGSVLLTSKQISTEINKEMKKMIKELKVRKLTSTDRLKFLQISTVVSSLLPKLSNNSFCEIDDLLYQNDGPTTKEDFEATCAQPHVTTSTNECYRFCFPSYNILYLELYPDNPSKVSHILDTTFLQLLENSLSGEKDEFFHYNYLRRLKPALEFHWPGKSLEDALHDMNFTKICLCLKILNICLDEKNLERASPYLLNGRNEPMNLMLLSFLQQFPQASHSTETRIISFIRKKSEDVFERYIEVLKLLGKSSKREFFEAYRSKKFDSRFIEIMYEFLEDHDDVKKGYHVLRQYVLEILHDFFKSAKTLDEKHQRVKDFLRGSATRCYKVHGVATHQFFVELFGDSFKLLYRMLPDTVGEEHFINKTDNRHRYVRTFLWVANDSKPADALIDVNSDPVYYVKKFFLYDTFMKCMDVLTLFGHIFIFQHMYSQNVKLGLNEHDVKPNNIIARYYILRPLLCPSFRTEIPYMFELILRKWYFLFINKKHLNLLDSLIKILQRQSVDEVTKERIFFALNRFLI